MALVKEYKKSYAITRRYASDQITCEIDAVKWISDARLIEGLQVEYMIYEDLINRQDEGNESMELRPDMSYEEMEYYYKKVSIDMITAECNYKGNFVIIGFDFREYWKDHKLGPYITIDTRQPADIDKLERELKLI
jgi:hypothetical protein